MMTRVHPMLRLTASGLLAGWLMLTFRPALAAWPITEFQIAPRAPVNLGIAPEDQQEEINTGPYETAGVGGVFDRISGADDDRAAAGQDYAELATATAGIAEKFSRAGFPAPYLMPVVNENGVSKYRVFSYSWLEREPPSKGLASYFKEKCAPDGEKKISRIEMNREEFPPTGTVSPKSFFVLGHELTHAVQHSVQSSKCFSRAFWISEGLANAASQHVTLQEWTNFFLKESQRLWPGLRPYDIPLYIGAPDKPNSINGKTTTIGEFGYATVSFWRFLAENFDGLKTLANFMDEPLRKGWSDSQLVDWLENNLRTEPNIQAGLYLVYPHFVTEFASLGGSRYMEFADSKHKNPKAARVRWMNIAFKGCYSIVLTPDKPVDEIPITVNPIAADCIKVRFEGFGGEGFEHAEVIGDDRDVLDQLHLGWAWIENKDGLRNCYDRNKATKGPWPPCILNAYTQTGPAPGKFARTWSTMPIDFGDTTGTPVEKIYVISNVAEDPLQTAPIKDLTFKIGLAWATLDEQASEPMPNIPVVRKPDPNKVDAGRPARKEDFYGIEDEPPIPGPRPVGVGTHRDGPGEQACHALIHKLDYGQTGDVFGYVVRDKNASGSNPLAPSSLWCGDAVQQRPIGKVLQSDETAFRVGIDTEICAAPKPPNDSCGPGGCPVVGRCAMQITIPFGWRQFPETAPTDIITPGVAAYIETMPGSVSEMMSMALSSTGIDPDSPTGAGGSPVPGDVARRLPDLPGESCACTCEEQAAIQFRGDEMNSASERDKQAAMAEFTRYMECSEQCQPEYLACAFEADKARRVEREAEKARAEAVTADSAFESCNCSCPALAAMQERGRYLEKQKNPAAMDELMQITQCYGTCSNEYMNCILQQSK